MTNQMIIAAQMVQLIQEGILTEHDTIHTYATWKTLGFQVRKGEHAVASFPIWKYVIKKNSETHETTQKMIMKTSAFFTQDQVDAILKP